MCEIYSRWSGGKRFGHFIIFCHPCPDWRQAAARVGNLTLNIVCLTRGIGFRNLIQNRLNKLGKYWLLEISQNKKSSVDTTNYIRLEGWFVVDVGAGDGPLSRRGWGRGWVFSLIGDQSAVFCKPFTDLSTVSTRTGDSAPLLSWRHRVYRVHRVHPHQRLCSLVIMGWQRASIYDYWVKSGGLYIRQEDSTKIQKFRKLLIRWKP